MVHSGWCAFRLQTPTARAVPLPFVLPRLLLFLLAKISILSPRDPGPPGHPGGLARCLGWRLANSNPVFCFEFPLSSLKTQDSGWTGFGVLHMGIILFAPKITSSSREKKHKNNQSVYVWGFCAPLNSEFLFCQFRSGNLCTATRDSG